MFIIRPCESEQDHTSVAHLAAELAAWDAAETQKLGIPPDEMTEFYYPVDGQLPGSAADARGMLLLASSGSTPAGCISYRELNPHLCELKRLYVRNAFRGNGLGKMMIAALVKRAAVAGYLRMCLETTHFMKDAVRLYEEAGFIRCGAYYTIPETFRDVSIFMSKDLAAS